MPETMLQTGGAFSTESEDRQRCTIRWMLSKGELLSKNGEQVPRILGVTVDVSDVKRAQFQLEQLAKRLMDEQERNGKNSANCTTTWTASGAAGD